MSCDCYKLRPGALWRRKADRKLVTVISRLSDDYVRTSGPEGLKDMTKVALAEMHDYAGSERGADGR